MSNIPRTNNSLESWHKQFAADISVHPDVNDLVKKFRIEQHSMELLYQQLKSGDVYKRKQTEINKDESIKRVIIDYPKADILKVLDNLILVLRNKK